MDVVQEIIFIIVLSSSICFFVSFNFLSFCYFFPSLYSLSLLPSCLGWSLPILEVYDEWVEEEEEVKHEGDFFNFFFMTMCMFLHSHNDGLGGCLENWFRQQFRVGNAIAFILLNKSNIEWHYSAQEITTRLKNHEHNATQCKSTKTRLSYQIFHKQNNHLLTKDSPPNLQTYTQKII